MDIVAIYEQFIAAGTAAKHCHAFDAPDQLNWLKNLQVVTLRAAMALKERKPNTSEDDLTSLFRLDTENIRSNVNAEADSNGCTSPRITQLLKIYRLQAEMNLN